MPPHKNPLRFPALSAVHPNSAVYLCSEAVSHAFDAVFDS